MSRKRKFITAASTFAVALGVGFVMQYGDAVASRLQLADASAPTAITHADIVMPLEASLTPSFVMPQATPPLDIPVLVLLAALNSVDENLFIPEIVAPSAILEQICDVVMDATVLPLAMVALSVTAPCEQNAAITIHHQGLMFTILADAAGTTNILVPAMVKDAFFIAAFESGAGAVASVGVPELANFDRAALQWQGVNAVQLHALEFGADYDTDGEIWSASAGDLDFVTLSQAGFLVRLGDDTRDSPLMVEVYTFPTGTTLRDGSVALSVEVEVTAENCERDVAAQSIQIDPASIPIAIDLIMTMPKCDAVGEFLVLKNMFKDLTLAAK